MVNGPTQNSSDVVSHPSTKRSRGEIPPEVPPTSAAGTRLATKAWTVPARDSRRCSMRSTDPAIPPSSRLPSTISTGTPGPTS